MLILMRIPYSVTYPLSPTSSYGSRITDYAPRPEARRVNDSRRCYIKTRLKEVWRPGIRTLYVEPSPGMVRCQPLRFPRPPSLAYIMAGGHSS